MDKYIPIQKTRKNVYNKIYNILLENSKEEELELQKIALNIERGIFNNTLEESIDKTWDSNFKSSYLLKSCNVYINLNPKSSLQNKNYIKNILKRNWNEFELCKLTPMERFMDKYPYCKKCEHVHHINLPCDNIIRSINPEDLPDGQFRCRQYTCKSWKTTHYEIQIRSSDEPMSIFVTCQICKNRYRIG